MLPYPCSLPFRWSSLRCETALLRWVRRLGTSDDWLSRTQLHERERRSGQWHLLVHLAVLGDRGSGHVLLLHLQLAERDTVVPATPIRRCRYYFVWSSCRRHCLPPGHQVPDLELWFPNRCPALHNYG